MALKYRRSFRWALMVIGVTIIGAIASLFLLQQSIPQAGAPAAEQRLFNDAYAGVVARVSEELNGYRASLVAPSLSVAAGIDGELVWAAASGYSDIETQTPATPDTVYPIGSVSKPVTAALAALLWQEGQMDIDADLRRYVPDFPAKRYPITLRQALSHQAGIRHYGFSLSLPLFSESALNQEFAGTAESLSLFADDPLLAEEDSDALATS